MQVESQAKPIDLLRGRVETTSSQAYVAVHTQPAIEAELLDVTLPTPTWDGSFPTILIAPPISAGADIKLRCSFSAHQPSVAHDSPLNTYEVDLRSGMFVLRHTDLFVKDVMPLALTRTYRQWDTCIRAFGMGTNHPYDICPIGSRNPYTYIDIELEDGLPIRFDRISKGIGYTDAVYEHTATASQFYKARFWWNGNGWTLRFADGSVYLFPEPYNAKSFAQGAPYEMRDAKGNRILLERDGARNLRALVSPGGHTINLRYDGQNRITEATDDAGHKVTYSYDSAGRLVSVIEAEGRPTRFTYDHDMMLTVEDGQGHVLVLNDYEGGRVSRQVLADGSIYRYAYSVNRDSQVVETIVTAPGGGETVLTFDHGRLIDKKSRQGS